MLKDVFREIKNSRNRFFSIFAIIALGAGFFAGLKVTYPDMLATMDSYYEEQNLMDIRLVSTYGFNENDILAINGYEGIKDICPSYSKDVFVREEGDSDLVAKVMSFPDSGINSVVLMEGRLPENPGECLVESGSDLERSHGIGGTVSVYTTDSDDPIEDSLEKTEWKIVGTVITPQYITYDRGTSTIGDGRADVFIMVPEENFVLEVYTEVYVTLDSTEGISAFDEEYSEKVEIAAKDFEKISNLREEARLEEIKKDAYEEIEKAKSEIADGEKELSDAEKELSDAFIKLSDGQKEFDEGEAEYQKGIADFEKAKADFEKKIADAKQKLEDGEKEIEQGWEDYYEGLEQYEAGLDEFNSSLAEAGLSADELYSTRETLSLLIESLRLLGMEEDAAEYEAQLAQLDTAIAAYEQLLAAESELEAGRRELEKGEKELYEGKKELIKAEKEAEEEFLKAEKELAEAKTELSDARDELENGWEEYYEGLAEFEEAKAEAETEIADAKKEIADAEKELSELSTPVWYILDRNDNPGYSMYETNAYIVENVGKVFPIFFFLVAMLVCLTTMTRMVEEQRTETGTLKALGYGKGAAISKYLIYAAIASISGAVFGIALCIYVFPVIIHFAYKMMFVLPELKHVAMPGTWLITVLVCILCTTLSVMIAGYYELKENPAELMRPKTPKNGKRVLLERVPFIWKKLSFNRKVTVRNLFRYKKRMLMTVLGISGCAALSLTGIGIYSSLSGIIENQYSEIFNYDLLVSVDIDSGEEKTSAVFEEIENNGFSEKNMLIYIMSAEYEWLGNTNLITVSDPEEFSDFIVLRERENGEKIELTDEGVVITERFAKVFGIVPGDEITFECDETEFSVKVTGVTEHYAMHFIYMTDGLYEKITGEEPKVNAALGSMNDTSREARDSFAKTLTEYDGVLALSFSATEMENFSQTIENISYVVVLIIVCAAALAFIVLYNLTNVNIMERIREIATIKVLGFKDKEVDSYVFRENTILSVMGAFLGLFLGKWLFTFVLGTIQTADILFVDYLPPWCYLAAFVMTVIFTVLVNGIMHFHLKKINMVESLKSVE